MELESVLRAKDNLKGVAVRTPLELNQRLSEKYGCNVYLKREDLQKTRSYKLRGAYNFLCENKPKEGVVCASAGNHAQGVAYACNALGVHATVFMPEKTTEQKVRKTKEFGKGYLEVRLEGETFDESCNKALAYCNGKVFVHPFNDPAVIAGQATVGLEVLEDLDKVDYLLVPVGGGGLVSGVGTYVKNKSPNTNVVGVEPNGAASMFMAFREGRPVTLPYVNKFVDGAAVKRVGDLTYKLAKRAVDKLLTVVEGKVSKTILELYDEGIVAEPAGALSIAALDQLELAGKNVVCVLSGGNNDYNRFDDIKRFAQEYDQMKKERLEVRQFMRTLLGR